MNLPPGMKLCPECEGFGWVHNRHKHTMLPGPPDQRCPTCKGEGMIPGELDEPVVETPKHCRQCTPTAMNWIVEDFHAELGYADLCRAIKDQGHNLRLLTLQNLYVEDELSFPKGETTLFQGSIQMARTLLHKGYWKPTAWLNFPAYDCTAYYMKFEGYLFNNLYAIASFQYLLDNAEKIWKAFERDGYVFVRPTSGGKSFGGILETIEDFRKAVDWRKNFLKPEDLILVSTPKNIGREWRFVTDGKDIIASSQYKSEGRVQIMAGSPGKVYRKAQEIVALGYQPDPMWCFDLCEDGDGAIWLLEIGSFSCSGLYMCDMAAIVRRASELALQP